MIVKLLTEHLLEVLCLKGGCTGSSESTLVKMPHCWKSHVAAHILCAHLEKRQYNMYTISLFLISCYVWNCMTRHPFGTLTVKYSNFGVKSLCIL